MDIVTADGKIVNVGDRVYNYYDCFWVIITGTPWEDGWFQTTKEDGTRGPILNGERISTYVPTHLRP
jgi:hypothetical protein